MTKKVFMVVKEQMVKEKPSERRCISVFISVSIHTSWCFHCSEKMPLLSFLPENILDLAIICKPGLDADS